jgi:hypothetical protein
VSRTAGAVFEGLHETAGVGAGSRIGWEEWWREDGGFVCAIVVQLGRVAIARAGTIGGSRVLDGGLEMLGIGKMSR